MGTHTGTTHPEQQRRIEVRAPKHEDEQTVVVREPGGPRGEGDSAPSQLSTASVPAREGSSDPMPRPMILTEERHDPQAKASRPPPRGRVAILVMGGTGTGKSSFIAEVTGQRVQIGHDLHSCELAKKRKRGIRFD